MLSLLPTGLLGLVLASLIAAFMSTISSHLNWGASYISIYFYMHFNMFLTAQRRQPRQVMNYFYGGPKNNRGGPTGRHLVYISIQNHGEFNSRPDFKMDRKWIFRFLSLNFEFLRQG